MTIGVYGSTAEGFIARLREHGVTTVVDVRQRRGVRGTEYAWANSRRLQALLAAAGIGYQHRRDLAPTTELRHLQYREDARLGFGKRNRESLAPEYTRRYLAEILDGADLDSLLEGASPGAVLAFLCVEKDAPACHRSLIARRLQDAHGVTVAHI